MRYLPRHAGLEAKPLLKEIYRDFYQIIAKRLPDACHTCVEIGAGHGHITSVIPGCIPTDISLAPGISRVENAYRLSFADRSVSAIILFDVFHHLRYPGTALKEMHRVLKPRGRLILLEPCLSVTGMVVYGLLHHEPLGLAKPLPWFAPPRWNPDAPDAYAAQGNASRLFLTGKHKRLMPAWHLLEVKRFSALSYVASGGYSRPPIYMERALPFMRKLDRLCDHLPFVFGTRLLAVLEKNLDLESDSPYLMGNT